MKTKHFTVWKPSAWVIVGILLPTSLAFGTDKNALEKVFNGSICSSGVEVPQRSHHRFAPRKLYALSAIINNTAELIQQIHREISLDGDWDEFEHPRFIDVRHITENGVRKTFTGAPTYHRMHRDIQVFLWMANKLQIEGLKHTNHAKDIADQLANVIEDLLKTLCMMESFINSTASCSSNRYQYMTEARMEEQTASFRRSLKNQRILIVIKVFITGCHKYMEEARIHFNECVVAGSRHCLVHQINTTRVQNC